MARSSNLPRVLRLVGGWALAWFLFVGLLGIAAGGVMPSRTFSHVLQDLLLYGALPGGVAGLLFALPFLWFAARIRVTPLRAVAATALGIASGIATVFPFWAALTGLDDFEELEAMLLLWSVQGGLTGCLCGLLPALSKPQQPAIAPSSAG